MKRNMRRLFTVLLILIFAFDQNLNVLAADTVNSLNVVFPFSTLDGSSRYGEIFQVLPDNSNIYQVPFRFVSSGPRLSGIASVDLQPVVFDFYHGVFNNSPNKRLSFYLTSEDGSIITYSGVKVSFSEISKDDVPVVLPMDQFNSIYKTTVSFNISADIPLKNGISGIFYMIVESSIVGPYVFCPSSVVVSKFVEGSTSVIPSLDDIKDELEDQRYEDRDDAEKAGSDSKSFVEDALDLENKWEILWFPIKFTNQILEVFTGGTSAAAYQDHYGTIVGYTYNDETGYVEPIIDKTRAVARAGGTVITFPEFTLPVLDVKLWDSYDFDLSTIKDSFPLVFDSIYVAGSILEVYWFVGFLRDKYEEVFG